MIRTNSRHDTASKWSTRYCANPLKPLSWIHYTQKKKWILVQVSLSTCIDPLKKQNIMCFVFFAWSSNIPLGRIFRTVLYSMKYIFLHMSLCYFAKCATKWSHNMNSIGQSPIATFAEFSDSSSIGPGNI